MGTNIGISILIAALMICLCMCGLCIALIASRPKIGRLKAVTGSLAPLRQEVHFIITDKTKEPEETTACCKKHPRDKSVAFAKGEEIWERVIKEGKRRNAEEIARNIDSIAILNYISHPPNNLFHKGHTGGGIEPNPSKTPSFDSIEEIYDNEINGSISWIWDGGFDLKLGDQLNGFTEEATVDDAGEIVPWFNEAINKASKAQAGRQISTEGKVRKGGRNESPTTPPTGPLNPPKGQGNVHDGGGIALKSITRENWLQEFEKRFVMGIDGQQPGVRYLFRINTDGTRSIALLEDVEEFVSALMHSLRNVETAS